MSDETTNPTEGKSEIRTHDQAVAAFRKILSPPESKDQPDENRGESDNRVEATDDSTEQQEDSAKAEQPEGSSEEKQEVDEPVVVLDDEEVPLSKLKEWKEGHMRQADYTKKTQEVAQAKQEWEEQRKAEEEKFRKEWTDRLAMFGDQIHGELLEYSKIDWDALRNEDPFTYQTKWTDYQRVQLKAQQAQKQIQQALDEEKNRIESSRKKDLQEQAEVAKKLIPELAEPAKAQKLLTDMAAFMRSVNFSQEEIDAISDGRALKIIYDAMRYRNLSTKGSDVAQKKVVPQTKVLKPGVSTSKSTVVETEQKARREQFARLKKSGKVEDAAAIFRKML